VEEIEKARIKKESEAKNKFDMAKTTKIKRLERTLNNKKHQALEGSKRLRELDRRLR
jgi:uncharacterized membrane protein YjjP (DUF1212 family)